MIKHLTLRTLFAAGVPVQLPKRSRKQTLIHRPGLWGTLVHPDAEILTPFDQVTCRACQREAWKLIDPQPRASLELVGVPAVPVSEVRFLDFEKERTGKAQQLTLPSMAKPGDGELFSWSEHRDRSGKLLSRQALYAETADYWIPPEPPEE